MKAKYKTLLPAFQKRSSTIGKYAYLVSLVANQLVIQQPHIKIQNWKTFYGNVFSAVEGQKNEYHVHINAILLDMLPEGKTVRDVFGEKLKYEYRQNETRDLATHAKQHFGSFVTRLAGYMKGRSIDEQLSFG